MSDHEKRGQAEDILRSIYGAATWLEGDGLACGQGCATCCTQSVTITSLEGGLMIEALQKQGRLEWLSQVLAQGAFQLPRPLITTNGFARACLEQRPVPEEPEWSFAPCIFLKDGLCTLYQARPFGCRAFISKVDCSKSGYAEVEPHLVTVNTVVQQVIEQLALGGVWGNMLEVLRCLLQEGQGKEVLATEEIPGFLVMPEERQMVAEHLLELGQIEGLDYPTTSSKSCVTMPWD